MASWIPAGPSPRSLVAQETSPPASSPGLPQSFTREPVELTSASLRFRLDRHDGSFFVEDPQSRTVYYSRRTPRGFASVGLKSGRIVPIDRIEALRVNGREIRFRGASSAGDVPQVEVVVASLGASIEIAFRIEENVRDEIASVRLLDRGLWVSEVDRETGDDTGGAAKEAGIILPEGLGRRIEPGSEPLELTLAGHLRATSPEMRGYSALAAGIAKGDGTLLITWDDPTAALEVRRENSNDEVFPGEQTLALSLVFQRPEGRVRLAGGALPDVGALDIGRVYRESQPGALRGGSLRLKSSVHEGLSASLGAVLLRMRMSLEAPAGLSAHGRPLLSFQEVGAFVERLEQTLELPSALFLFEDWLGTRSPEEDAGGEAPRIALVPAPECGGEDGLIAAAERIHDAGYFVGFALDRAQLVPDRAAERPAGEAAWRLAHIAAGAPEALPRLRDLAHPDLLLLREPRGEGFAPPLVAARDDLLALLSTVAPLGGGNLPWEGDLEEKSWIEGLFPRLSSRNGDRAAPDAELAPLFLALYSLGFRLADEPGAELEPNDAARLLLHLLLAQPPAVAMPADYVRGESSSRTGEAKRSGPEWCFAREGGWSRGRGLGTRDIFLKTAGEVTSYVAGFAAREPLVSFRTIDAKGEVFESRFGYDLRIVANFGEEPFADEATKTVLPQFGFVVFYPFFYAFHAIEADGVEYDEPALFTVRSLEGKLYLRAEKTRIWHGFGPDTIRLGGRDFTVERETEVKIW